MPQVSAPLALAPGSFSSLISKEIQVDRFLPKLTAQFKFFLGPRLRTVRVLFTLWPMHLFFFCGLAVQLDTSSIGNVSSIPSLT